MMMSLLFHALYDSQSTCFPPEILSEDQRLPACTSLSVCVYVCVVYIHRYIVMSIACILALHFYVVMNIYTYLLCKILGLMSCIGMSSTVKP